MFVDNIELVQNAHAELHPTTTAQSFEYHPSLNSTVVQAPTSNWIEAQDSFNTTNTSNTTTHIDNSINNTYSQEVTINLTGNNNTLGSIGSMDIAFDKVGTDVNDNFSGNFNTANADKFRGGGGDDLLTGYRGADLLMGDAGNDEIRGGNGKDVLMGGDGADELYGGFGMNTFAGELDGEIDKIYFKSDEHAYNWLYASDGNQDGSKVDVIEALDAFDEIEMLGISDDRITYLGGVNTSIQGKEYNGIGIFADGTLEALYTGGNLSVDQLNNMTTGYLFKITYFIDEFHQDSRNC